jgi:calcium-dependent protein kinase|tara:strand:+ start:136 stop:312 length:177 start_codon:yes stop_codon:yes gene_type:complete
LFKEVDTDGDGVLTKKELKFFIKNLKGPKISVKAFNRIVAAADEDGDGLIDFNEFIES